MSCHVETLEFAGNLTPVIFCGSGPAKRFCRFCGARATALCDWPKVRREAVRVAEVQRGARVFLLRRSRETVQVEMVYPRPAEGEITIAFWWRNAIHEQTFPAARDLHQAIPGTCDAPVCFRHLRHVGPDRDYCKRHWKAWEAIA